MPSVQVDDNLDTKPESPLGWGPATRRPDSIPSVCKAPIYYISRLAQATQVAIDVIGVFPYFDLVHKFFQYLELEYGGIHRD